MREYPQNNWICQLCNDSLIRKNSSLILFLSQRNNEQFQHFLKSFDNHFLCIDNSFTFFPIEIILFNVFKADIVNMLSVSLSFKRGKKKRIY